MKKIRLIYVKEAKGEKITEPEDVYKLMKEEAKADRECFWVLHLSTANTVIEKELVGMGSLNACVIHPREVFKKAIINGSNSIMMIHNHPSGNTKPSEEDNTITHKLADVGRFLHIPLTDSLIISGKGFYSYSQKGEI